MVSMNTGSLAQLVRDSIDSVPTSVDSGTNIVDWINLGAQRAANYTGQTVSTDNVAAAFQPMLFDWGRVMVLSKMMGVGVDFNVSLGEFSVSKSEASPEMTQLKISMDNVKMELLSIGKQIPFSTAFQ